MLRLLLCASLSTFQYHCHPQTFQSFSPQPPDEHMKLLSRFSCCHPFQSWGWKWVEIKWVCSRLQSQSLWIETNERNSETSTSTALREWPALGKWLIWLWEREKEWKGERQRGRIEVTEKLCLHFCTQTRSAGARFSIIRYVSVDLYVFVGPAGSGLPPH